ncbi:MAG: Flp family type IVb pilin [Cypionkella sp.]
MSITRKTLAVFAKAFAKDEQGATAIEYGLFAALIGAVIVGTVATLGQETNKSFDKMSTAMSEANDAPATAE